jgi:Zn-finger protein
VCETPGPGSQGAPVVCGSCGAGPTDAGRARLSWSVGVENGRTVWTCADCSRRHLRSIEAKLDSAWW